MTEAICLDDTDEQPNDVNHDNDSADLASDLEIVGQTQVAFKEPEQL